MINLDYKLIKKQNPQIHHKSMARMWMKQLRSLTTSSCPTWRTVRTWQSITTTSRSPAPWITWTSLVLRNYSISKSHQSSNYHSLSNGNLRPKRSSTPRFSRKCLKNASENNEKNVKIRSRAWFIYICLINS